MKIVTWNCNGAFRKKLSQIDSVGADLLIIQECENPELSTKQYRSWAGEDYLWVGTNKNKGLGVFPKKGSTISSLNWAGEFKIEGLMAAHSSLTWATSDLKLFLPFKFNDEYTFLAVWTKGSDTEAFGYVGQFWKYLQIHRDDLKSPRTIILGDFNSNSIWDKPDRWWSHSGVVDELAAIGIHSVYHYVYGESQGEESRPTFYHQKNINKPYHIDYVFSSSDLIDSMGLQVGAAVDWLSISDHVPLILSCSS